MAAGSRELTNGEREAILREVLLRYDGVFMKRMPNGLGRELADKYSCHESCIRNMNVCVASMKKGRVGRPPAFSPSQVKKKIAGQQLHAMNLTHVFKRYQLRLVESLSKKGIFRAHSRAIRPLLTDANKYSRVKFALSFVNGDLEMNEMMNHIHLDEKWFYLTPERRKFYLIPHEELPDRKCKSKRYITKVLFLTAVARPHYVEEIQSWWDGKIGTWPFLETVLAQRSSANREAGTPETKVMNVTKYVYRSYLIDKVLPTIAAVWPNPDATIVLQHDNAKAHVCTDDAELRHEFDQYRQNGWSFTLAPQPPKSPDMNVLDLGFFAGLQSLQYPFNDYPLESLDRTFRTLQSCLLAALQVAGDNTYAIPHMSKEKMARRGLLPRNVVCPVAVHDAGRALLSSVDALELERSLAKEIADLQVMNDLSYALEIIALDDADQEDITTALNDLGIEPIDVSES
ncbi:Aste57867_25287 [Aphanomyces stellatus]|uniref:Aste57867_25287 protein n=1 Tax=Aphanomyces stellatus TaxID=120398 RepID=A0A485LTN5_9STRA|nr:hypothetical protein As57867_025209 [Aphanomyces stellatus]VFU01912.1 Aste57867_25287 [Aphanomyces stellatus]